MANNNGDSFNGLMRIAGVVVMQEAESIKAEVLVYELAAALIEEVYYSQTPSEHTLQLLEKALKAFPNTEFSQRYEELGIAELLPVD